MTTPVYETQCEMLNFRRLKQDLPQMVLQQGRELHEAEAVLEAKILAVEADCVRVGASVQGNYEHVHACELEIDRRESEMVDSACDCPRDLDCQHLAAILFHLERALDGLLVDFSQDAELADEELQEVVETAKEKEADRKGRESAAELLTEYEVGANALASSPFFLPKAKMKVDRAELAVVFASGDERQLVEGESFELHFALRLPYRSKPLFVPDARAFLDALRYGEPIQMGTKRYFFTPESFGKTGWAILERLLEAARFVPAVEEVHLRYCAIDPTRFGAILADVYELVTASMGYHSKEEKLPLPGLFEGTLEQPLTFSTQHALLRFVVEHLTVPAPKIFLKPTILLEGKEVDWGSVNLMHCAQPGLLAKRTYYRFNETVQRRHLCALGQVEAMTIPEPLFGTFIENALPELLNIAEVTGQQILQRYPTLPYAGDLSARCDLTYCEGTLEARLFFLYDEMEVPAAPSQLTFDHATGFVTSEGILARNLVEERALVDRLFQGFTYEEAEGSFIARAEKRIVEFMTAVLPSLQEQVAFECPANLKDQFLYDDTTFTLHFSEAERIDAYSVELQVEGHLKGVKIDTLWETLSAKRTFIELEKKSKSRKILVLDVNTLRPVIQLFDEIGLTTLENHAEERPLWSLANLKPEHFAGLPVKMTISDGLREIQEQMLGLRSVKPSPIPSKVKASLRPYQKEGVHWLERLRLMRLSGILADDMGLGKTLQGIIALTQFHQKNKKVQSLVVCPTSLLYNWQEEFAKFNPGLKVQVIDGTPAQRKKLIEGSDGTDILVTSYTLLQKDVESYLQRTFGYCLLDEAQHIKNRGTRNAKSVKRIRAAHRLILTGTPVENSLEELWSLFDYLMPGLLSSFDRFVEKYIRPSGEAQTKALDTLSKKVAPFILRRMKVDVLDDLPPVSHITYHCNLSETQKELYQSYAASAREELSRLVEKEGFDKVQIHVLATLTRLKQICCHPAIFAKEKAEEGDSAKYDMLMELLQTLIEGNHKSVIFSQYTRMLGLIRDDLEKMGIRFCYLDGATKNRLELVKQFNEDPRCLVFLVSLKAGGTGLNLVGADTVIHYDMWWNPAVENQATDRVHRIGQKNSVSAYKLVTKNTIEEKIVELQKRKEGLVKSVVSCDDEAVSKLTWEEVLELLQV